MTPVQPPDEGLAYAVAILLLTLILLGLALVAPRDDG